ncbi:MAG TPA: hypothetical protein VGO62_03705, partial [Myxococcota bacterium]
MQNLTRTFVAVATLALASGPALAVSKPAPTQVPPRHGDDARLFFPGDATPPAATSLEGAARELAARHASSFHVDGKLVDGLDLAF